MPIIGVIASSRLGAAGDFESIATVSVGSGGAANVEFTNIPNTYSHLQIRASYLCSSNNNPYIRAGGSSIDTAGNYSWHHLYGDGSSALNNGSGSQTFVYFGYSQNASNATYDSSDYHWVPQNNFTLPSYVAP